MKHFLSYVLLVCLTFSFSLSMEARAAAFTSEARQADVSISAPSAVLMEAETGTLLYQKEELKERPPASITKIMTLDLIFDALDQKKISLNDQVTVSEHAASMGGSQVYLEPGEIQTVESMIKCISIASANDACVAMAEYLAGSEEAFVGQMNQKASSLGMKHTHFENCCGLDTEGHLTCAYDIALMSRDLILRHPKIHDYCTIWMDTITHTTRKGSSPFGLTNTNRLIRQYPYATGLKTGSTGLAKYCLSATAEKDGLTLIAVVLASPNPKMRFQDAAALLDYGFASCKIYHDKKMPKLPSLTVVHGKEKKVDLIYKGQMVYVTDRSDEKKLSVKRKLKLPGKTEAPIKKGSQAGSLVYFLKGKEIGRIPILYQSSVQRASLIDEYCRLVKQLFHI